MAYVPLFCQSHHSAQGVNAPGELVRRARALGYSTLGLADEVTVAGFDAFETACSEGGIRPVFGCRLRLGGIALTGLSFPVDCVIQSEQGYRNLVRMLSLYHARERRERRPFEPMEIRDFVEGLFVVIPPEGELMALIAKQERGRIESFLDQALKLFGQRLVIGLAPAEGVTTDDLKLAWELARFAQLTPIAAHPVRYAEPGDDAAAVYLANPLGPPGRSYKPPRDLKTLPALAPEANIMARWEAPMNEAPHEAGNLARICNWRPSTLRRAFPSLDLERGFDPNSYLFDLVIKGAKRRYGEIREELKARINRELEDIKANHLAPWMLLNYEIARVLDEAGISRGVGRGRLVASVLAYCLGVTRIDPLAYNLNPRGLGSEGEVYPPVAIEIPRHAQPQLLERLRKTFGEDRLAEIGRIKFARRDQLCAELAEWAGMTGEETRLLQAEKKRLRTAGAAQRLSEMTEKQGARRWRDTALAGAMIARLAPRPRYWEGCGDRWAVSGEPMELAAPPARTEKDGTVTGLEERAIDRLGLARLWFAPHHLLDIYDHATRLAAGRRRGFDPRTAGDNDRAAFDLLGRGETDGIPPLESVTVRCLLRKHRPTNLLQLLRVLGEARQRQPGERPAEITDQLPDVLLSYQCACLKAHDPLGFYCAAIAMAVENRRDPLPFIRAVRRGGYEVAGPDIALSDYASTIQGNAIRLGLGTVSHLGPRAWENILDARSGDPFNSFEHFCQSVDLRIVRRNILRALVGAGALDRYGPGRAAMDAMVDALARQARARATTEGDSVQATLFAEEDFHDSEFEEAIAPEAAAPWNEKQRLLRERESLGFFLSIDPIERFPAVMNRLRPLQPGEIGARHAYQPLRVAGVVCGVERGGPLLNDPGDAMLDIEGLAVLMAAPMPELYAPCLETSAEVMVMGSITREHGYPLMIAEGIWKLDDLESQNRSVKILELNLEGENRQTLKTLDTMLKKYPGDARVSLAGFDGRKGLLFGRAQRRKVFFCSPLYQGLCKVMGAEAITLYGRGGEQLEVRAAGSEAPQAQPDGDEPIEEQDFLAASAAPADEG